MLVVDWWIPKSPRFYFATDRPEIALAVLARFHANDNERDEVVQLEFAEITAVLTVEKVGRGRFGIGITDAKSLLGINGGLTMYSLITNVLFPIFVDRWGRRRIQLISTAMMLATFVIWTIISARYVIQPKAGLGKAVVAMILLYCLGCNLKSGLVASYTTEILPCYMRAKGYTITDYALYITLFFNQYVNSVALDNFQWRYYILPVSLLCELLVIYFFVRTKYLALEEIIKLFDGDDVAQVARIELEQQGEKGFSSMRVHVEQAQDVPCA